MGKFCMELTNELTFNINKKNTEHKVTQPFMHINSYIEVLKTRSTFKAGSRGTVVTIKNNHYGMFLWYILRFKEIYKLVYNERVLDYILTVRNAPRARDDSFWGCSDSVVLTMLLKEHQSKSGLKTNFLYPTGIVEILYLMKYVLDNQEEFSDVRRDNILEDVNYCDKMLKQKYNIELETVIEKDLTIDNLCDRFLMWQRELNGMYSA